MPLILFTFLLFPSALQFGENIQINYDFLMILSSLNFRIKWNERNLAKLCIICKDETSLLLGGGGWKSQICWLEFSKFSDWNFFGKILKIKLKFWLKNNVFFSHIPYFFALKFEHKLQKYETLARAKRGRKFQVKIENESEILTEKWRIFSLFP